MNWKSIKEWYNFACRWVNEISKITYKKVYCPKHIYREREREKSSIPMYIARSIALRLLTSWCNSDKKLPRSSPSSRSSAVDLCFSKTASSADIYDSSRDWALLMRSYIISVTFDIAETTTNFLSESSFRIIFPTLLILSALPTHVPPNLWTDHVSPLGSWTFSADSSSNTSTSELRWIYK